MKTITFLKWRLQLIIALLVFAISANTNGQDAKTQNEHYGQKANELVPGARFVQDGSVNEYPAAVKFSDEMIIETSEFVPWLKLTFEMSSDIDFALIKSESDELGYLHQRYAQTYKGITIDRADYIVQSSNGRVISFRGDAYLIENVNTVAALDESLALKHALDYMGDLNYLWNSESWENEIKEQENDPNASYFPVGDLIITKFGNANENAVSKEFRLAYRFDIYAEENEEQIVVDAITGEILYTLPLASNCEPAVSFTSIFNGSQNVRTDKYTGGPDYRLRDDCQTTEIWVRDWNSATDVSNPIEIENTDNSWTNMDERFGATVLWESKESYRYFKNAHGRSSFDGADGEVKCYINAVFKRSNGTFYTDNASMAFNGSRMKVGLGSSNTLANSWSSLDIIAHEFTHAVTGTSSNLVYQGEPGALNESFSDIFGEMVENYSAGPNDWLMGDDRADGAIRSIEDPKTEGDPDTYNGTNWKNTCNGCSDRGGVHSNSGVQNYWFYLVAIGGTGTNDNGDDYTVSGIGRTKASNIAFRNQTLKLGVNSDYADARTGAIEAAEDLYGACSNEVKTVTNAWYAVGVGDPYVDVEVASSSDISCFGLNDGSITIDAVGTAPLTYLWNDGVMTKNRSGLGPGVYSVIVTDATGCSVSVGQLISEPDDLTAVATATSDFNGYNISCFGESDGVATVSPSGGKQAYSYQWDVNAGNQVTAVATNLSAGSYWVVVTDANGCTTAANVVLDEPDPLVATISDVSDYNGFNISCNGGSDGWATVTGSGGVAPYTYDWSNLQTTQTATNLMADTYFVTITDANGCEDETMVTLTEPTPLTIEAGDNQTVYYGYPPAECADISWSGAGGGVPPYNISWNDGGSQTHEVCPGEFTTTYTVTITDLNGCVETDEVTICVIDVRCGKKLDKVELCHVPLEDPGNEHTICVSINAVATHLADGDMLAACGTDHSCPPAKSNSAISFADGNNNSIGAYPNPFNQSTRIEFLSSTEGNVTMKLYEVSGKEIAVLFNATVKANELNTIDLDENLAKPGLNICLIQYADGSTEAFKLIFNQ